jgi:uncharacterized caspase-like protein
LFVDDLPSFISASPAPAALSAPSALTAGTGTTASGATVDTLTRPGSGQRWALVVGISRYADSRIPALRYADADAAALHEWLVSPEGGRYAPANVRLLLNGSATGTAIRSSLFTWLQSALAEDMVLVFFAGHGSSDAPGSRGNLFLLPYDVRYDDIAGTAFPMWDLRTALDRFIRAKRVVVLADACHSAGVGEGFDVAMRAGRDLEVSPLVNGFQSLSEVSEGVCVLTASDAAQYSQEAAEWGGGHGVFTYFFLEGLRGAADYDKNGTISLGEMIPYLSQSVRRATRNAQSPTVAGRFDPALTFGQ